MSQFRYSVDIDPSEPNTSHALMIRMVGGDKRVLDLGCAEGDLARALTQRGCKVSGVESDTAAAETAADHLDVVVVADLARIDLRDAFPDARFDVVVLGDVLEHLSDPVVTLRQARSLLAADGYLVISLPNIAHASVRIALLQGEFRYRDLGLLDATHLRFFTRDSMLTLLDDAGLVPVEIERTTVGPYDTEIEVDPASVPQEVIDLVLADPDATTYQFVVKAVPDDANAALSKLRRERDELEAALIAERTERQTAERASTAAKRDIAEARRTYDEQLSRLTEEKTEQADTIWRLQQECAALTSQVEHGKKSLRRLEQTRLASESALRTGISEQTRRASNESGERIALQQRLDAIEHSTSWRVTRPLRRLGPLRTALQGPVETRRSLRRTPSLNALTTKIRRDGLRATAVHARQVLDRPSLQDAYLTWIKNHDVLTDRERAAVARHIERLQETPLISVVMPVYRPNPAHLRAAVESVQSQLYPHWELCIADDASGDQSTAGYLSEACLLDSRIRVVHRAENGGIAAATNSALELVTGEFVALLDHDDMLSEHALYIVACEIDRHPNVAVIYSDEDKLDEAGRRTEPYFKPDFNFDLLLAQNCISHLGVYRRSLLREIGGLRADLEGSQDHDLALRAVAACGADAVRHIPFVLYHWRQFSGSGTFSAANVDAASASSRVAVQAALDALGTKARVEPSPHVPSWNRIRWCMPSPPPAVTAVIPTRDRVDLLQECLQGLLERTDYDALHVVIVDNDSREMETLRYLEAVALDDRVDVLPVPGPFNYSRLNNSAIQDVDTPFTLLLNNDIVVRHNDWLSEMVAQGSREGVGAVGAKLLYEDERVQHGGVLLGVGGVANHAHLGFLRNDPGYFGRAVLAHGMSAVTGACLLTPTQTYRTIGGLNEEQLAVAFNDVDYCLRVAEFGQRVVWTPYAELFHLESASRASDLSPEQSARFHREIAYMHERWGPGLRNDPAYNPNLSITTPDFSLATKPRVLLPWEGFLEA